jgi:hypothetical protein
MLHAHQRIIAIPQAPEITQIIKTEHITIEIEGPAPIVQEGRNEKSTKGKIRTLARFSGAPIQT